MTRVREGVLYVALCGWAAKADDSIVCFGAKPDKGFLDMKSRRMRKWEGDAREAVDGRPGRGQLVLDSRRALTTRPGREAVGAGQQRGSWRLDSREASSRELAWNHGQGQSTPDTGAERRGSMG